MIWLNATVVGTILSLPYAFATWIAWQSMKTGTLLSCGKLTSQYGIPTAIVIKTICFVSLIIFFFAFHWWVFMSAFIMWFIGSYIAKYIERIIYAKKRLKGLDYHARQMVEKYGEDKALIIWISAMPSWWTNLMSWKWEKEYKQIVGSILKSKDPSDPLFDVESFKNNIKNDKV